MPKNHGDDLCASSQDILLTAGDWLQFGGKILYHVGFCGLIKCSSARTFLLSIMLRSGAIAGLRAFTSYHTTGMFLEQNYNTKQRVSLRLAKWLFVLLSLGSCSDRSH